MSCPAGPTLKLRSRLTSLGRSGFRGPPGMRGIPAARAGQDHRADEQAGLAKGPGRGGRSRAVCPTLNWRLPVCAQEPCRQACRRPAPRMPGWGRRRWFSTTCRRSTSRRTGATGFASPGSPRSGAWSRRHPRSPGRSSAEGGPTPANYPAKHLSPADYGQEDRGWR
jgi:hypothetical protein